MAQTDPPYVPWYGVAWGWMVAAERRRNRWSQDELARRLSELGWPWTRAQVAALENGRRRELTLVELIALSDVFGFTLAEWVDGRYNWVQVTADGRKVMGAHLAGVLRGAPPRSVLSVYRDADLARPVSEAETRVLAELGLGWFDYQTLCLSLWGRRLDEERDARLSQEARGADVPSLAGHRGHVTRLLVAELREGIRQRDAYLHGGEEDTDRDTQEETS